MSVSKRAKLEDNCCLYWSISKKCYEDDDWERTGNMQEDFLHLYNSGMMYDCTFRVCKKDFKCHKNVLGSASQIMQRILFDKSSKWATFGRDEPIQLMIVSDPIVFDLTMKFIYGGETDFVDTKTAIMVYDFANRMNMKSLVTKLEQELEEVSPEDAFAVLDMYVELCEPDKDHLMEKCIEIINTDTEEAFNSDCWLSVSELTVTKILSTDSNVEIEEVKLLEALLAWGKANFADASSPEVLRDKLLEHLKEIRFCSMTAEDFANVCQDLDVLTSREKYKIFLSILTKSPDNMPDEFSEISEKRGSLI